MTYEYLTWQAGPDPDVPTFYRCVFKTYTLAVDEDPEFFAWTWSVKDLETGALISSGLSRYDTEAIKQAERIVRYDMLGVNHRGY